MIMASIMGVTHAKPLGDDTVEAVIIYCKEGQLSVHLPIGTAEAVAACINVAVAAGARAEAKAAAQRRWHEVCEAMNKGTWDGTEAEALAEVARCKAIVEGAEQ